MNSRKLAGASAASVGAATAVVALLLGTVSGNAGEGDPRASAFGIAAKGLLPISPTPYVEAPPDDSKALLEVPGPDKGPLRIALLKVEAEAFRSKATAVDVAVLGIELKLIEARCDHGRGDASIIGGARDGGKVLPSSPYKGQELDLSPILKVEFNRQKRDRDKLTVDALVVSLLPGDHGTKAVTEKDLTDLQGLAPNLKVPTMQELEANRAKSAPQQQQQSPRQPRQPQQPQQPQSQQPQSQQSQSQQSASQQSASPAPTVADLVSQLKTLNPNLVPKGDGDALLEIVISSASCNEEGKKEEKEEAPKPKPVEADLPVTH